VTSRRKLYAVAGAALAAEAAAYLAWRPTMLRWGTQASEATELLPGDDLVPHPRVQSTRATTIDAPPGQVWPWIVQMGIGRAGFYTHDRVERLMFHARYAEGKHSATRIRPELQDLKAGDLVPYGAGAYVAVHELEPSRHLVAGEAFVLRPLPSARAAASLVMCPARIAAFSAARRVAFTRTRVAVVTGRPIASCWRLIPVNIACSCAADLGEFPAPRRRD
jgi:hypothetical protein